MEPEFDKAAADLKHIVHFAAIDVERAPQLSNAVMQKYNFKIEGVPTMRFVSPGSLVTEEYRGERTAKALKAAAYKSMPSFVDIVTAAGLDAWVEKEVAASRKALLFSEKGAVPALFKAISSAYRGYINFAQVTIVSLGMQPGKALAERFELSQLPSLVVLRRSADDFEDEKWQAEKFGSRNFAALSFGTHDKPSFRKLEAWLMGYSRVPRTAPAKKKRKVASSEL